MGNVEVKKVFISKEISGNSTYETISDFETGEIYNQKWLVGYHKEPGRRKTSAYFIKLYRTNLMQIAKDKKLDLNEAGLLFMLLSIIGWQTPYIINPDTKKNMSCSDIADYLGLERKYTGSLLDRLVDKGMIGKVVNGKGRANSYMINTNVSFWGKTIDDTNHLDVFANCSYEPEVYIKYRKTPEEKK